MSVAVTRYRGGGRDEDGKISPPSTVVLQAFGVAPTGGHHQVQLTRDGETVDCTVYFKEFVDLTDADELAVNGKRYKIIVNEWRSPWGTDLGGLEVLCTRGQG